MIFLKPKNFPCFLFIDQSNFPKGVIQNIYKNAKKHLHVMKTKVGHWSFFKIDLFVNFITR